MAAINNGAGLSRRGFLVGSGGALAALALAACTPGGGAGGSADTLSILLPGTAPPDWDRVLKVLNAKLKKDVGFEFKPEFIQWSEYASQSLLKFTAGEKFETALSARWLNMAQLVSSGAIVGLNDKLESGKYKNITDTVAADIFDANRWSGEVMGIPAVNSAARLHHYAARGDLVEKYAGGDITSYDALEKFWYDVKQKENLLGHVDRLGRYHVIGAPTGMFYAEGWENPDLIPINFTGDSLAFIPSGGKYTGGAANLVPFWEHKPYIDALRRVHQYYEDGIINADMLNVDSAAVGSVFDGGGAATTWAITDGSDTQTHLAKIQAAVAGSSIMSLVPLKGGLDAKPNQTFQADNVVVINAAGADNDKAMQLLDWVSIKENHDLLEYGEEGKDWNPIGDDRWEPLSDFAGTFPGYALSWRIGLERKSSLMSESEDKWFTWSQDTANFTLDPFASFIPDLSKVESENSQITAVIAELLNPLLAGVGDVDSGLDNLKKAVEGAGLATLQEEINKQADEYLDSL